MSHHPTKFGGHRHFGSRDMLSVCLVISLDCKIEVLCNFILGKSLIISYHPVKCGGHKQYGSQEK